MRTGPRPGDGLLRPRPLTRGLPNRHRQPLPLEHGAAFGPFVAGPEGVELFEVMMGDPRSWPADPEGFEKLLREKGARKLPNPEIELPDWLEDIRTS